MSKTITTLLVLALIIGGSIWFFGRDGGNVARDLNATSTVENLTGTGGPDDGYDPLENWEEENHKG